MTTVHHNHTDDLAPVEVLKCDGSTDSACFTLRFGEVSIFINPGRLAELHAAIGIELLAYGLSKEERA